MDAGGDKSLPCLPLHEANPILGRRGLRLTLEHPDIFQAKARALLCANAGLGIGAGGKLMILICSLGSQYLDEWAIFAFKRVGNQMELTVAK